MNPLSHLTFPVTQYLEQFQRYYPRILEWYSKVENEVPTGRRGIFFAWDGAEIEGLAITKNSRQGKLCHISVSPSSRDQGLGRTLMYLALREMVQRGAKEIRVTTSEEVFREHASFFCAAGFKAIDWQVHRYRHHASEILWKLDVNPSQWQLEEHRSHIAKGFDLNHWARHDTIDRFVVHDVQIIPLIIMGSSIVYTTRITNSNSLEPLPSNVDRMNSQGFMDYDHTGRVSQVFVADDTVNELSAKPLGGTGQLNTLGSINRACRHIDVGKDIDLRWFRNTIFQEELTPRSGQESVVCDRYKETQPKKR